MLERKRRRRVHLLEKEKKGHVSDTRSCVKWQMMIAQTLDALSDHLSRRDVFVTYRRVLSAIRVIRLRRRCDTAFSRAFRKTACKADSTALIDQNSARKLTVSSTSSHLNIDAAAMTYNCARGISISRTRRLNSPMYHARCTHTSFRREGTRNKRGKK